MISQQEMVFQLAALQRQRDVALYQVVMAEARIGMLETELSQVRAELEQSRTIPEPPKDLGDVLPFRDRQSMTEP
jgi:hypothetical protein